MKKRIITGVINGKDNGLQSIINANLNSFRNYSGFTLETEISCKTIETRKLGSNNISIILDADNHYYTIRFINYSKKLTLVRITETLHRGSKDKKMEIIQDQNKLFNKLDYYLEKKEVEQEIKLI